MLRMLTLMVLSLLFFQMAQAEVVIHIDGSSTVFPITEAVAEEFGIKNPKTKITVGVSGTGGGFKKFCNGEIDINDASRLIKTLESADCRKNKISYVEMPVAYDGLSVVVNSQNTWVNSLTVAELKKIWEPDSKVKTWKDVRSTWPDRKIILYGPGTDSGTFDYFTEVVNGKAQASRSDFTKSEDDNVLVQGIVGDKDAMGYFGHAYYEANKTKLKVVPIQAEGGKAITPTTETIANGTYKPLSRMIYIYVSVAAGKKKEVSSFIDFYMKNAGALVKDVGYISLENKKYETALSEFNKRIK
ncbi:MAG: PstS family phosphate ABC transporter substrate-binding protein [Pseudomonadota bacterium]|nr:PstS family phosphate ABC transporter substrate-binding protein [Pseudomonadota bacterium]